MYSHYPTPGDADGKPARQPCPNCGVKRPAVKCVCQTPGCGCIWVPTYGVIQF